MVQLVTGLTDPQLAEYEAKCEAAMVTALQDVADVIADRIAAIQVASARVVWDGCPRGFHPPHDGPCALVAADEPPALPPGQPYVSPDDLAGITPLWEQAVAQSLMPVVAQVWQASSGQVYAQMVDASGLAALPAVSSIAAEQYLAQAANTFKEVGGDLWETARNQLLDGFQQGESIPELAARVRSSAGMTAKTATLVARTQVLDASNAGSIATARASGLALRKGWEATGDLRTRPSHTAAWERYGSDDEMIPLEDKFIVGGFACDRPHDPSLPPSERYSCRCSILYAVSARSGTPVRQEQEPPLPGQSGRVEQIAAEQRVQVEQVFGEVHEDFEGLGLPPVRPPGIPARIPPPAPRTFRAVAGHRPTMTRAEADAWAADSQIPFDLQHGTTPAAAEGIARRGFDLAMQGTKTDMGNLGAGFYFNATTAPTYGEATGYGATLTIRANVQKVMLTSSEDYARANAVETYIDILHSSGQAQARRFLDSDVLTLPASSWVRPAGLTNGQLMGELSDDQIARYLAIRTEGRPSGFVLRQYAVDNDFDAIVWDFDTVIPGYPVRDGRTWFEINVLKPEDITIIRPTAVAEGAAATGRVPVQVRASLLRPKSVQGVTQVWEAEMRRITGRDIRVIIPPSIPSPTSILTTREYAEGVLRGLERFPDANLVRVEFAAGLPADEYAHTIAGVIRFNGRLATEKNRPLLLSSLRGDIQKWDDDLIGWSTRGDGSTMSMAIHEMGHIVDLDTLGGRIQTEVMLRMDTLAKLDGVGTDTFVAREISAYSGSDEAEMIAEAFADVLLRGDAASIASRRIFEVLEREYAAGGKRVGITPGVTGRAVPRPPATGQDALKTLTIRDNETLDAFRDVDIAGVSGIRVGEEIAYYSSNGHEYVNLALRTAKGDLGKIPTAPPLGSSVIPSHYSADAVRDMVRGIDAAMTVSRTTEPILVYRGLVSGRALGLEGRGSLVGKEFVEQGYSSTSVREASARRFTSGGGVLMRIRVPEDIGAIGVENVQVGLRGELEVLLQRGLRMRITADEMIGTTRVLDVEVLPAAVRETPLARRPIAELRTLARERGVTIPAGAKKPDIIRLLEAPPKSATEKAAEAARAAQQVKTDARTVGEALADVLELQRNQASARVLSHRAGTLLNPAGPLSAEVRKAIAPLAKALQSGDQAAITRAAKALERKFKLTRVDAGRTPQVLEGRETVALDRARMELVGGQAGQGSRVYLVRPGYEATIDGQKLVLVKAQVQAIPADVIQAAERKALREAARVKAAQIESATGTANLLAEVDRLLASKAEARIIRQTLDPKLIERESLFAGADPDVLAELRRAAGIRPDRIPAKAVGLLSPEDIVAGFRSGAITKTDALQALNVRREIVSTSGAPGSTARAQAIYGLIRQVQSAAAIGFPADAEIAASLRSAITRLGTKAKIKPVSRAGAKVKYDPATMEPVGGEIKAGTQVTVVTRGSSVTLPDRTVVQLTKAKVTPVGSPRVSGVPKPTEKVPAADLARAKKILGTREAQVLYPWDIKGQLRGFFGPQADVRWLTAFRDRHPETFMRLIQSKRLSESYREWRYVFPEVRGTLAEVRAKMVAEMRDQISDAPILVRRARESSLRDILERGRMRTQFETGTSSGSLNTELRSRYEQMAFGYPTNLDPALRPVYGYLSVGQDGIADAVSQYGTIRIKLKESVRARTSFTVSDSLGGWKQVLPTPVDSPGWESFNVAPRTGGYRVPGGLGRDYGGQSFRSGNYIEAQIHGGVTVDDIEEVIFGGQPEKATIDALARAGVPWRIE